MNSKSFYHYPLFTKFKMVLIAKLFGMDAWSKYHRKWTDKSMNKYGPEALSRIGEVALSLNADWCLVWGSVLAYYREHGFIKGDNDIDIGMKAEDFSVEFVNSLIRCGFEFSFGTVNKDYKDYHIAFNYKNVKIDIYTYSINDDKIILYSPEALNGNWKKSFEDEIFQDKWGIYPFKGFREVKFVGEKVKVFNNADEVLRMTYGDDFMTPIKGKKAQKSENILIPDISNSFSILINYDEFVDLKKRKLI